MNKVNSKAESDKVFKYVKDNVKNINEKLNKLEREISEVKQSNGNPFYIEIRVSDLIFVYRGLAHYDLVLREIGFELTRPQIREMLDIFVIIEKEICKGEI